MSHCLYSFLNEGKPVHGSRIYSRQWAGATAVTAGTVEDE